MWKQISNCVAKILLFVCIVHKFYTSLSRSCKKGVCMDDDRASGVDIEQVDDHRNSKFVNIKSEPLRPCKFTLLFGQAKAVSLLHILAA